MNWLRLASSLGLALLGVLHVALTSKNYVIGSEEALWFAGTGALLIASGIFVFAADQNATRITSYGAGVVSLIGLLLSIWSINVVGEPQSYALALLYAAGLISAGRNALLVERHSKRSDTRVSSTWRRGNS